MNSILKKGCVICCIIAFNLHCSAQLLSPPQVAKESDVEVENYTGIIAEQYANGSPSLWKMQVNGKAEGLWLEWYPDGTLRYRAYWKNGLGNGKWEYFYPNGTLRSESFYIDDIAQGLFRYYHNNGVLKTELSYLNGKKEGIEKSYSANGILISKTYYESGTRSINEPTLFQEEIINDLSGQIWGITFTPDGLNAYFTKRDNETGKKRIYLTTNTEGQWSKPIVASFSIHEDEAPFINQDGSKLFFASYRPLPDGSTKLSMDMNIWVMSKRENMWSIPKPVSDVINHSMKEGNKWPANYEAGPHTDLAGNLYYWTNGSESKATNLFFSKLLDDGIYDISSEIIPPSREEYFDTAPFLSSDGNLLFFASDDREDGYGGSDLYYAVKTEAGWSEGRNLGPVVNSSQSEGFPSLSPDGKYLYFSSNRGDARDSDGERLWRLYYMETRFLLINN